MKIIRAALLASSVVLLPHGAQAQQMDAEVLHWWTSGGESAAVKVFADEFNNEGGNWIDTAIAGGQAARNAGVNRIVGGNPPTVMQFNTGGQFVELVSNGLLRDLESVAGENDWRSVLPAALADAASRDGKFYAVPVNIHGQNWLFTNLKVLADAGVEQPQSFAELIAAGPKLREAGVIPLGHGGQNWQDNILFDAVLLEEGGPGLMKAIYGDVDTEAARGAEFRKAAEVFAQLRALVDEGSPGRNWNEATNMVLTGKAAAQVMGDWAKGEFIAAGLTAGTDYGCTIMPGGYMMGGDVFVFPKVDDAAAAAAQDKMAALMLSPGVQVAFNEKKGSVPARLDVDVSSMDACAQAGMEALQNAEAQVPSNNFYSPDLVGSVRDVITEYWNSPAMTPDDFVENFVSAMESAY
ncbi:ABC transporter substrate-binding protein [Acuticoccus sp. MNP-M23]|uniref:ABC transporter substrate-binding protein n=1 Tax=Acuticoccus sp. MNP-M23 TaxID=3072793 RepID=UPI002815828C|nr:ABC transporter substrate-binding protein [Acuticoccus sp. MNP-M23]WMS42928.1 ABC transporter substrate-binding protein [Acuticoccus sp. MNP-M23]